MPRHEITWLHTRLSPGSAVQSRKFWVAKRTNHGGLLGGPCYLWVVGMYDVVGNDNETAMSLCVIYFKQYQMVRDWYFELYSPHSSSQPPVHLCFAEAIKPIAHPKITQILSFSWGFHQNWYFAHPKISFAHPELPFLAKSMILRSLWKFTGSSAAILPSRLSHFKVKNYSIRHDLATSGS